MYVLQLVRLGGVLEGCVCNAMRQGRIIPGLAPKAS